MKAKICGIKSERDLTIAVNAGADAVGFITDVPVDSPRKITISDASMLISKVPIFVTSVLVIMPKDADEALSLIRKAKPSAVQIHNYLPTEELRKIRGTGIRIIKTIPVTKDADVSGLILKIKALYGIADAVLLDTSLDGRTGGTGIPHNWGLSSEIVRDSEIPVILAGGLNPENVKKAVQSVRPYAVDTASGVETDGRKDESKVVEFINNARGYEF